MRKIAKMVFFLALALAVMIATTSCGVMAAFWNHNSDDRYEKTEAYHIMRSGECEWTVLEEHFDKQDKIKNFGEFVYTVRAANGLTKNGRVMQPGDVLVIPLEIEKKK